MLFKGGFFCKLFEVPDLDGFIMGAGDEHLVFGVDGQGFDGVGVCLVDVSNGVDLVDHELMLLFDDVMLCLHICTKIFKKCRYDNYISNMQP